MTANAPVAASRRGAPRLTAAVAAIARNTFREAVRDRVLYLLLVFALILIAASRLKVVRTIGRPFRNAISS